MSRLSSHCTSPLQLTMRLNCSSSLSLRRGGLVSPGLLDDYWGEVECVIEYFVISKRPLFILFHFYPPKFNVGGLLSLSLIFTYLQTVSLMRLSTIHSFLFLIIFLTAVSATAQQAQKKIGASLNLEIENGRQVQGGI